MTNNGHPRDQQRRQLKYFRATTSSSRRKWSDWSECSEGCRRTRHRLNCDDIITNAGEQVPAAATQSIRPRVQSGATGSDKQVPMNSGLLQSELLLSNALNTGHQQTASALVAANSRDAASTTITTSNQALDARRQLQVRSSTKQNQPTASNTNKDQSLDDDQDYADEGDEDDEDDSCANVEPSKTFEEQACFGGQCKQPAAAEIFRPVQQPSGYLDGHHHGHHQQPAQRARAKAVAAPSTNGYRLSAGEPPPDARASLPVRPQLGSQAPPAADHYQLEPHTKQHQQTPQHHHNQQQPQPRPMASGGDLVSVGRAHNPLTGATTTTTGWTHGHPATDPEARTQIELNISAQADTAAATANTLANASDPWLTTPRSMWHPSAAGPMSVMNSSASLGGIVSGGPGGGLLTSTHLLQLGVLTGFILSLVMLTIFIIRRLFIRSATTKESSYNWMLASQQRLGHPLAGKLLQQQQAASSGAACCHHQSHGHGLLAAVSSHPGDRLCCPSLAKLNSGSAGTIVTTTTTGGGPVQQQEHHENCQQQYLVTQRLSATSQQQQQQLCYLWERQPLVGDNPGEGPLPVSGSRRAKSGSSSFVASLGHLAQQFGPSKSQKLDYGNQPCYVDINGCHFLANNQQRPGAAGNGGGGSTGTSTSSRSAILKSPNCSGSSTHNSKLQTNSHFLEHLPFDPLYTEPNTVQGGGVAATTLDYDQVYNYDTLELTGHEHQMATGSPRCTKSGGSNLTALAAANHHQLVNNNNNNKQPPNVPTSMICSLQGAGGSGHETTEKGRRASSALSAASMSSGGGSSPSIQSVTAQLLSNETSNNSSSLDHTADIPADYPGSGASGPAGESSLPRQAGAASGTRKPPLLTRGTRLVSTSSQPQDDAATATTTAHLKVEISANSSASNKRRQFKLSNADRSVGSSKTETSRPPPPLERQATGGGYRGHCDNVKLAEQHPYQRQQNFYEEIGRN